MKKRHKNESLEDFKARRKECNAGRRAKDRAKDKCPK